MCKIKINFTIQEMDRGFLVTVGCKTIATDIAFEAIILELKRYFDNPQEVQKEYFPKDFENECCQTAPGQDIYIRPPQPVSTRLR